METDSSANWEWPRRPGAKATKGLVVCGERHKIHYPGEKKTELLNAILKVGDGQTAASFVRRWGFLGFTTSAAEEERRRAELHGALELARATARHENPDASFEPAQGELIYWHDQRPGFVLNLAAKSEPVQWIIEFAERMRLLSEAIHVLALFKQYDRHANDRAAEWVSGLSPECYQRLIGSEDLGFWEQQHETHNPSLYFYEFLLGKIIEGSRSRFSHRSQRGVWVQLSSIDGQPVFEFDSLFRFVEYSLLSENVPSPKRCEDPQCGQLFFPTRKSRRYCPRPLGRKRSLCGQRYSKQQQRSSVRDETDKKHAPKKPGLRSGRSATP